jgi:hypothetical protein
VGRNEPVGETKTASERKHKPTNMRIVRGEKVKNKSNNKVGQGRRRKEKERVKTNKPSQSWPETTWIPSKTAQQRRGNPRVLAIFEIAKDRSTLEIRRDHPTRNAAAAQPRLRF